MTLMNAPQYDARRARLIRDISIGVVVLIVILGAGAWFFWNWPSEHRVNKFFAILETGDLAKAYAQWNNDPDWQQHADRYKNYDFAQFQKDWGSSGDYGVIKSHQVMVSKTVGNGVIIGININGGKTPIFLRVDHQTKQIGFSPVELYTGP